MRRTILGITAVAAGLAFAALAHADPDTEFTQRTAHLRDLRPEGLQRLDREEHLQAAQQRRRSGSAVDGLHLRAAARFTESLKRGCHDFRSALAFAATA